MRTIILFGLFTLSCLAAFGQFSIRQSLTDAYHQENYGVIKPGDLNLDGVEDLIVVKQVRQKVTTAYEYLVEFHEGLGGGDYASSQILFHSVYPIYYLDLADLDNNGFEDLIFTQLTTYLEPISVMAITNFGGQFVVQEIDCQVENFRNLYVNDVDEDGVTDLLVMDDISGQADNVEFVWVKGDGTLEFTLQDTLMTYSWTPALWSVEVVDLDSDGDKDLFYTGTYSYQLNDNGVYSNPQYVDQIFLDQNAVLFDWDGDQDLDVISGNDEEFVVALNNGLAAFDSVITVLEHNAAESTWSYLLFDDDFDGQPELLIMDGLQVERYKIDQGEYVLQGSTTQEWLMGDFNRATTGIELNPGEGGYIGVAYTDSRYHTELLAVDGSGAPVSLHKPIELIPSMRHPRSCDLNEDGITDFVCNINDSLYYILGTGGGTFSEPQVLDSDQGGSWTISQWVHDIDSDGDEDILLVTLLPSGGWWKFRWFQQTGPLQFTQQDVINTSFGLNDLCMYETTPGAGVSISISEGNVATYGAHYQNGSFSTSGPGFSGLLNTIRLLPYDANDDGFVAPIAVSEEEISQGIATGLDATDALILDVDHDGIDDVVITNFQTGSIDWIRKTGPDQFDPPAVLLSGITSPHYLEAADLNGSGFEDFVVTRNLTGGGSPEELSIVLRDSSGAFIPGMTVIDTIRTSPIEIVDVDHDGDIDIVNGSFWWENFMNSPYRITGSTFYDHNGNGVHDGIDTVLPFITIELVSENSYALTQASGVYEFTTDSGEHIVLPHLTNSNLWTISTDSLQYNVHLTGSDPEYVGADFGFTANGSQPMVEVEVTSGFPRCSEAIVQWITAVNTGNTLLSGVLSYQLDSLVSFGSSTPSPDSIVGNILYFHVDSLWFNQQEIIQLNVSMPSAQFTGEQLSHILEFTSSGLEPLNGEFTDELTQTVMCSYDPNDKMEEVGYGELGLISAGETLEYTIRFQNTGNDTAFNVVIRDQLSEHLLWHTLTPMAWSHPVTITIDAGGEVSFSFENINLLDSLNHEPESHGFIKFSVQCDSSLVHGVEIPNTAFIYFDDNPPIQTNTEINTVYECVNLAEIFVNDVNYCFGASNISAWTGDVNADWFSWLIEDSVVSESSNFMVPLQLDTTVLTLIAETGFCGVFTDSIQLNPFAIPEPIIGLEEPWICLGDSVLLTAIGSIADQNIWWSDSILIGQGDSMIVYPDIGFHSFVLSSSNADCPAITDSASIQVDPVPTAFVEFSSDSICVGELVEISSDLSGPETVWYLNSDSIGENPPSDLQFHFVGDQTIEVRAFGCLDSSYSDTLSVVDISVEAYYDSESDSLFAVPSGYAYVWYHNGEPFSIGSSTGAIGNGEYIMIATNSLGCRDTIETIWVSTGISELQSQPVIHPNPTRLWTKIKFLSRNMKSGQLSIFNPVGEAILELDISNAREVYVNTSEFTAGVYSVLFSSQDNPPIFVGKLVVN